MNGEASLVDLTAANDGSGVSAQGLIAVETRKDVSTAVVSSSLQAPDYKAVLEQLTLFLAPTSLVTALLYWLGYQRSAAFWKQLGAHQSVVGMSTTDYMTRAMDTTFLFLGQLMVASILVLLFHRLMSGRISSGALWEAQLASRVLMVVGAVTTPIGLAGFLPDTFGSLDLLGLNEKSDFVAPAATMCSTLCLAYAGHLRSRIGHVLGNRAVSVGWTSRALFGLVLGMLVLSTFWMADSYANSRGQRLAKSVLKGSGLPVAEIYSKQRLALEGIQPGLIDPSSKDVAYRYKYSGLRLLFRSKESYLLLSPTKRVVVLPQSSDVRIEYPPRQSPSGSATPGPSKPSAQ